MLLKVLCRFSIGKIGFYVIAELEAALTKNEFDDARINSVLLFTPFSLIYYLLFIILL